MSGGLIALIQSIHYDQRSPLIYGKSRDKVTTFLEQKFSRCKTCVLKCFVSFDNISRYLLRFVSQLRLSRTALRGIALCPPLWPARARRQNSSSRSRVAAIHTCFRELLRLQETYHHAQTWYTCCGFGQRHTYTSLLLPEPGIPWTHNIAL